MSDDWDKFRAEAAFSRASATLVIGSNGHARILTAYPRDGAGRLSVYIISTFAGDERIQRGMAGGYGYDKRTAALSGLTIDGHKLTNHCHEDEQSAKFLKAWKKAHAAGDLDKTQKVVVRAKKAGYSFANWSDSGYGDCYREGGLDFFRARGYQIFNVL